MTLTEFKETVKNAISNGTSRKKCMQVLMTDYGVMTLEELDPSCYVDYLKQLGINRKGIYEQLN